MPKPFMEIKLEIPGELRERIKTFLANLDEALRCAPENQAVLTDEISKLEADDERLRAEIGQLQSGAVSSDAAAAGLNAKEIRVRQITARLETLRAEVAGLKPIKLYGAGGIIQDLVRFYLKSLPEVIADFIQPICPTRHKALTAVKFCDAYTVLWNIRDWGNSINSENANPSNIEQLKSILNRALRGQPHLGADAPQAEAA
jgi:hypothetical protein